jgi:hypothetical protein
MATNLAVSFDYSEIKKALEDFGVKKLAIQKKCINRVLLEARKEVKKGSLSGGIINRRKGNLYNAIYFKTIKVKDTSGESETLSFFGFPNKMSRRSGKATYYAKFYEIGRDIIRNPRTKAALSFQGPDGKWIKAGQTVLKYRGMLMKPTLDKWIGSGQGAALMEREILQANLNRVFGAEK